MKQVIVGIYEIGYEQAELVIREGTGGEFYWCPEKGKCVRIKIGGDYEKWQDVVAVLLHEAMELTLFRNGCRYRPSEDLCGDHSMYLFSLNHPTYSDCCAKTAEYLAACLPDLGRAWNAWNKKGKGKK